MAISKNGGVTAKKNNKKGHCPTGFAILISMFFSVSMLQAADAKPFSEWKMNEGQGQVLKNSADKKNNGWLGDSPQTDAADPRWQEEGERSTLLFAAEKSATIPDSEYGDFSRSEGFSIQIWFKPMANLSDNVPRMQLLTKGADSAVNGWQLRLLYSPMGKKDFLSFMFKSQTKDYEVSAPLPYDISDTWNRVTIAGNGRKLKLYLNGKLLAETACDGLPRKNPYPLKIGTYAFDRKFCFIGNIRDLKIYREEITPDEIVKKPSEEVLLDSDFKIPGPEKDWSPMNGKWFLLNGAYCEHSDKENEKGIWSISGQEDWKNYCLNATIGCLDNTGSILIGIGWRNIDNHYEIIHRRYGSGMTQLTIAKMKDGRKSILASIDDSEEPLPVPAKNRDLNFKIYFYKGIIAVMINGNFYLSAMDGDFLSGKVAVGEQERKISVKSVKVRTLHDFISPIQPVKLEPVAIHIKNSDLRHAFYRGEIIHFNLCLQNNTTKTLAPAVIRIRGNKGIDECKYIQFPELNPGNECTKPFSLQTASWKSGEYDLTATIEGTSYSGNYYVFLAPEKRKDGYKFYSWGGRADEPFFKSLHEHGFNGLSITINPAEDFRMQRTFLARMLDQAVKYGQDIKIGYTCLWAGAPGIDARITRHDGSRGNAPDPWNPDQRKWTLQKIDELAGMLKGYPAINGFLLNSENENIAEPDYSAAGRKRVEEELGFNMPVPENRKTDKDNTAGRLIHVPPEVKARVPGVFPDTNEWYRFFKWFWQRGYGDNYLNEDIKNVVKKHFPDAEITHDPFRDVPLFYRNKGLDQVGSWFYPHPDASETLGMAETLVNASQDESKMKGINFGASLWLYADQICPAKDRYAGVQPTDIIIESDWLAFSRIPAVIEHYCIADLMPPQAPQYKQDNTYEKLALFSKEVLQPLWPTVSQLRRAPRECAMLLSFGSQLFGSQIWSGYGYSSGFGYYAALQMAHIPTDIIFDENIQRGDLSKYKILFMHNISHLPQSVFNKIIEFAKNGGTVLCEEPFAKLIPGAIKFDMDMAKRCNSAYYCIKKKEGVTADIAYQDMLKNTDAIRKLLNDKVKRFADCDSPSAFLNVLEKNGAEYVFVVNDKRTFGDYVGKQYRAVMETGLPQTVNVFLNTKNPAVYDLMSRRKLNVISKGQQKIVALDLKPAWGTVLAIYPQEIEKVHLILPPKLETGKETELVITITDKNGNLVPGVQPLSMAILDPGCKINEYSGYFAAENGLCKIKFIPAGNDLRGKWSVSATELSSGIKVFKEMEY